MNKVGRFCCKKAAHECHKDGDMLPPMTEPQPRSSNIGLAGAGGTLVGMTGATIILCTLIGWAFGSWTWGLLVGAILGIPVGIAMVIKQYGRV